MFRRYFVAGLLVWIPIIATVVVVRFFISAIDGLVDFIPPRYQPSQLLGMDLPIVSVVVALLILLITGLVFSNYLGRRIISFGESILDHIPLVRTIYKTVKQLISLVANSETSFKSACLVQYPRIGIWTLAFITSEASEECQQVTGSSLVSIFVPTTPNPTSGFFLMVAREDIHTLKMKPEDAIKLVMSAGVVTPEASQHKS